MTHRVCFIGTPAFAVPTLQALIHNPNLTVSVISMPDAPFGRRRQYRPSPVKSLAMHHSIPVTCPTNRDELTTAIQTVQPDLVLVVAYGRLIPKAITDAYLCVNIHSSLLPAYRGPSPIHQAILNGDTRTGITMIHMNEAMDEGDILLTRECPIQPTDNLGTLTESLAQLGAQTAESFITDHWIPNRIQSVPQCHAHATYTKKIMPGDGQLTVGMSAVTIHRTVQAYAPKPGAFLIQQGRRVKIIRTMLQNNQLTICDVQPDGKPVMPYHAYLQGYPPIEL